MSLVDSIEYPMFPGIVWRCAAGKPRGERDRPTDLGRWPGTARPDWNQWVPILAYATGGFGKTRISSPGHGRETGESVRISEADNAAYNGIFTITVIDADYFTIPVAFTASDNGKYASVEEVADGLNPACCMVWNYLSFCATEHWKNDGQGHAVAADGWEDYRKTFIDAQKNGSLG